MSKCTMAHMSLALARLASRRRPNQFNKRPPPSPSPPLSPHPSPKRRARLFHLETVEAERAIFLEGDAPKALYILLSGSVDLAKKDLHIASLDGAKTLVGAGHPFFGAAALLTEVDGRSAPSAQPWDAFSRTPCSLLCLSWRSLKPFLRSIPDFRDGLHNFVMMRRRAWELERGVRRHLASIATAPDLP